MTGFVSIIAFLTALFAQASTLQCYGCIKSGTGTDCTGVEKQSPSDVSKCIWGMENNTVGDSVILTPFRHHLDQCKSDICGSKVVFTAPGFFVGVAYQCCQDDYCNDGRIKGSYDVEAPNGYTCLSCFTENDINDTTNCIPNTIMDCTGNQKECLTFTGKAARPGLPAKYYSIRGCITTGGCVTGVDNLAATKLMVYDIMCSPADKQ